MAWHETDEANRTQPWQASEVMVGSLFFILGEPSQTLKMEVEKQRGRILRVLWRKNRTDNVTHPKTTRPPHLAQISDVGSSGDEPEKTDHEGS